jgi:hypothetical protein
LPAHEGTHSGRGGEVTWFDGVSAPTVAVAVIASRWRVVTSDERGQGKLSPQQPRRGDKHEREAGERASGDRLAAPRAGC